MAKFSKIMVNQRFRKNIFNYHTFPCIRNIFKRHSLMASSLHMDPVVEAFCLNSVVRGHHINFIKIFGAVYMARSFIVSAKLVTFTICMQFL